ncbi:MAG: Do family serine endopeptidase [Pseudomonadota bacterium]|nr:Do family serine endopeptidase [Pseudomonadota bacterium]
MVSHSSTRKGVFGRSRKALLAGAASLALLGLGAGEMLVVWNTPAVAQISVTPPANSPASFAPIVQQVLPAVVSVSVRIRDRELMSSNEGWGFGLPDIPEDHPLYRWFRRFGEGQGQGPRFGEGQGPGSPGMPRRAPRFGQAQGSGFFISPDGYIVTNNHVVQKSDKVEITTNDGSTYSAKVVGVDERTDLALLKIDESGGKSFPHVRFAARTPEVGDWVIAVGNPFGLGGTVTAGIVSARGRDIGAGTYDDFLQIDAPINRGNSGGPTFNLHGEVVGVNTAIYSPSGGSIGIGFAIPSEVAANVVQELKDHGQVTRGWLGVQIQPVTKDIAESLGLKEARGALVNDPQQDGPAAKAGIRSGDIIVSVNGEPIKNARELARKIAALRPNSTARIGILRNGKEQTVDVTLGKLPTSNQLAALGDSSAEPRGLGDLGLTVAPAGSVAGAGSRGVVVTDVEEDSEAASKGIKPGDVILEVGGQTVQRPADVSSGIKTAEKEGRKAVLLRIQSGDQTRFVALNLKKAG